MNIPLGPTTKAFWATSAVTAIPLIVKLVENGNTSHLGQPEQVSSLISLVLLAISGIGRYAQAHAAVKAGK